MAKDQWYDQKWHDFF